MADATGWSRCRYCGAEYRLFTIFNKDMNGLCKAWRNRHEFKCKTRTPAQRLKWAKPYIGKDRLDSSIVVDLAHPGFSAQPSDQTLNFEQWFDELTDIVLKRTGVVFQDKDAVMEDFEAGKGYESVAESIVCEYID